MSWRFIPTLMLILLGLSLSAKADRIAKGSKESAPVSEKKRYIPSITKTSYFGTEKTTELREAHEEFSHLFRKFSQNPKLSDSLKAVERGLAFFVKNKKRIPDKCGGKLAGEPISNEDWMVVTDYTKPHDQHRMFFLNLETGEVISAPAAHGYGSNRNCPEEHKFKCKRKGRWVEKCKIPAAIGDTHDSGRNSRGFYLSDNGYVSGQPTFREGIPQYKNGEINAIYLQGLLDANKNSFDRRTVFHRASYVQEDEVNLCSNSAGCPSTTPEVFEKMKEILLKGTLFYSHTIEDEEMEMPDC